LLVRTTMQQHYICKREYHNIIIHVIITHLHTYIYISVCVHVYNVMIVMIVLILCLFD